MSRVFLPFIFVVYRTPLVVHADVEHEIFPRMYIYESP